MSRDQRRSLWPADATAGKIAVDPDGCLEIARKNLRAMRTRSRGESRKWLDEWERLLDGSIDRLLDVCTSRSLRGRELRQNSPFAGVLGPDERERALEAWQAQARR